MLFHPNPQRMYTALFWSTNIFKDLSQPDSLLVLGYLGLAFLIGSATIWWMKQREIKDLNKTIKKQNDDISFYQSKNGELAVQVDLLNAKKEEGSLDESTILTDLNHQVTELKQAHFYLKKDYDMAIQALHSAKEQAEEMQKTVMGSNVLPQTSSPADINTARKKVKRYLRDKMDQQTTELSFNKELMHKIGEDRVSPIDQLDEGALIALAALISEQ